MFRRNSPEARPPLPYLEVDDKFPKDSLTQALASGTIVEMVSKATNTLGEPIWSFVAGILQGDPTNDEDDTGVVVYRYNVRKGLKPRNSMIVLPPEQLIGRIKDMPKGSKAKTVGISLAESPDAMNLPESQYQTTISNIIQAGLEQFRNLGGGDLRRLPSGEARRGPGYQREIRVERVTHTSATTAPVQQESLFTKIKSLLRRDAAEKKLKKAARGTRTGTIIESTDPVTMAQVRKYRK